MVALLLFIEAPSLFFFVVLRESLVGASRIVGEIILECLTFAEQTLKFILLKIKTKVKWENKKVLMKFSPLLFSQFNEFLCFYIVK